MLLRCESLEPPMSLGSSATVRSRARETERVCCISKVDLREWAGDKWGAPCPRS